jgi:Uma2 family endonuclease
MLRVLAHPKRMTFEEYLEFEKRAETKHEFVDGFIFAMAGANNAYTITSLPVLERQLEIINAVLT